MTDRYKGFLVTLDKEIRSDDAEHIINALKMVRGVQSVKPYVKGMQDYMEYEKAKSDIGQKILEFVRKEVFNIPDSNKIN
jgi:hypothetical protein